MVLYMPYLQRRRNLVHDGSPPPEHDDDLEIKMKPRTEPRAETDDTATRPRAGAAASTAANPLQ